MGDEEIAVDEVDVGLDAVEAVVEGVEQRTRVIVVVVRVGAKQRARAAVPRGGVGELWCGDTGYPLGVGTLPPHHNAMLCLPAPRGGARVGGVGDFASERLLLCDIKFGMSHVLSCQTDYLVQLNSRSPWYP